MAGEAFRKQGQAWRDQNQHPRSLLSRTIHNPSLREKYKEWRDKNEDDLREKQRQLRWITREN